MKHILILLIFLLPQIAVADPSQSTDSGRDTDTSRSNQKKRDKSLSADKARGNRATQSDSIENSRERSRSNSRSNSFSSNNDLTDSYSSDININGLLLREFSRRYERTKDWRGQAGLYFSTCRPLLNAVPDYPVQDFTNGGIQGRNAAMQNNQNSGYLISRGDGLAPPKVDSNNRYISRYAQCRMTASYWIAEAGDRVSSRTVTDERQVQSLIRETFGDMDGDEGVFQELRQRARDTWQDASCSNWLDDFNHYKSPELDCGVFTFIGKSFTVEYRETLSENSINGRSYKISMSASESESFASEDSVSTESRTSHAERDSDQRERFTEAKKTASMSKTKSTDRSRSSKETRSSGSGFKVVPKD